MTRFAPAACLFAALTVLAASPGEAQEKKPVVPPKTALAKKVTINLEKVPVQVFLAKASKDTGGTIVIDGDGFERAGVRDFMSLRLENVAVKDVLLSKVLTDTLKTVEPPTRPRRNTSSSRRSRSDARPSGGSRRPPPGGFLAFPARGG